MAIFSNSATLTGAGTDDYLLGDLAGNTTIFGGAGRDVMFGDSDNVVLVSAVSGISVATAINLTSDLTIWSEAYNPDILNSTTVAHATAVIEGNNTSQFYAVTMTVGQILTLDVDYGDDALGTATGNVDTILDVLSSNGTTVVATNDDAAITEGGLGSNNVNDGFLTFTATVAGVYYIRVQENGPSVIDVGDNYMLNISLTNQAVVAPSSGNDDLFGGDGNDVMYGIGGNDKLYGGNDNDYMTGDNGNDTLDGGAGVDKMYGGANNDMFVVANGFAVTNGDEIYGGSGTDTLDISGLTGLSSVHINLATGAFTHSGTTSINVILDVENAIGTSGNDTFTGNASNNVFTGGNGNDIFDGGLGTDTFFGGAGNDTFLTNASNEGVIEAVGGGTNDVVIASSTFTLAAGNEVELIQTNNVAGIVAINLTGNALAQSIIGNAANNALNDGGAGAADTLTGHAGNDSYSVGNAGTIIVEAAAGGTNDSVAASVSFVLAADDNIEVLRTNLGTGTTAINLTGNALKQSITGNNGNNVLNSGGGAADTLSGASGNDTYVVNSAADTIVEIANQGTADQVNAAVSFTLDSSDNIEIMMTTNVAGVEAINLTGNTLAQTITGNAGANVLDGKDGADILTGGTGADVYSFSTAASATNIDSVVGFVAADDQIEISNVAFTGLTVGALTATAFLSGATNVAATAAQRIIYNSSTGALFYDADGVGGVAAVQFATLAATPALSAADFLIVGTGGGSGGNIINGNATSETLTGTGNADTIYGFAGNDTIDGGAGNDVIFGGLGNDIYTVATSADIVTEFAGEGTDTVNASATYTLSAGSEVELLQTTNAAGTVAINLIGNTLSQSLIGNAANNSLNGGGIGGIDTLTGLTGNDIYGVANAGTIIVEVAGGGTADRVAASVNFILAADDDIEILTTSLSTGTNAINLTGNALKQSILGNNGNNALNSGGGVADTMTGLLGDDVYIVRNAADVVVETAAQGTDTVRAAVSFTLDASDDIEFMETFNPAATSALNLTGNALAQTITGNAGDNILDGKGGNDILIDGNGIDTFVFSTALNAATNVDTLVEYDSGTDIIGLSVAIFGTLAGVVTAADFVVNATGLAETVDQNLIYNSATGALSYDVDGLGGADATQFATLTGAPTVLFTDFVLI